MDSTFSPRIRKSENQKIKNGASEMISVPAQLWYKSQKWKVSKTLSLKDMRWSEFPWRGNFQDESQKCFGPEISDFPKLSVTALFWWAKGRRPLGPPTNWVPTPFESKFLPAVLLLLRIYFPKITVTVTVLKFGWIHLITITVTVLKFAVIPSFPLIPNYHLESHLN